MSRCWSRTLIDRCNCCCIVGSWVLKPGERHARPTSCMTRALPALPPALSLLVNGAEGLPAPPVVWLLRSRRRGRCREVGIEGDVGSFLTITLGMWGVWLLLGWVTRRQTTTACKTGSERWRRGVRQECKLCERVGNMDQKHLRLWRWLVVFVRVCPA